MTIHKKQLGGLIIDGPPETAINNFIDNSTIYMINNTSSSGVIFLGNLKDGIPSPYKMIRSTNFDSPVKQIIIKLVAIDSEVGDERDPNYVVKKWKGLNTSSKKIEQEVAFRNEISIQQDIFFETVDYLDPLCPAPIYFSIKKDLTSANAFIDKMYSKAEEPCKLILNDYKTNLDTHRSYMIRKYYGLSGRSKFKIPYLGILGMELANDYKILYNSIGNSYFELYKNMARLQIIQLALKTGYSQNDWHMSNILLNTTVSGYYKDMLGRIMLIDFGYATKIPAIEMQQIRDFVGQKNYVGALRVFRTLKRSDDELISKWPTYYGWLWYGDNPPSTSASGVPNPAGPLTFNQTELDAKNATIIELNQKYEAAQNERVALFNASSDKVKFPNLPLTTEKKEELFPHYSTGSISLIAGKNRRNTISSTSGQKYNRKKRKSKRKSRGKSKGKTKKRK